MSRVCNDVASDSKHSSFPFIVSVVA